MPFVPLGSRKNHGVLLDSDKEILSNQMKARDQASFRSWEGAAPGPSGYRFARHQCDKKQDVPFRDAGQTWRPPSADPIGPAAQRGMEHASVGATWEKSHRTLAQKSQSMPSLGSVGSQIVDHQAEAKKTREACNPLSVELRRWQNLAEITEGDKKGMIELPKREKPEPPKPIVRTPGLVNFPKYMLIHNCHLKQTEKQRYVEEQEKVRKQAEDRAIEAEALGISVDDVARIEDPLNESMVPWQTASWGAPRLRKPGKHWAGSSMPAGKSMRTSNPFRMG